MTVPVTDDPSNPSNAPIIAPVTTAPDAPIVVGQETTKVPTTTNAPTTVATNANGNSSPDDNDNIFSSIGGFFSDLWNDISGSFSELGTKISTSFGELKTNISDLGTEIKQDITDATDSVWDKLLKTLLNGLLPFNGQQGMLDILKSGGSTYVDSTLDTMIDAIYKVIEPFGVVIMLISFCFAVAKGCFSTDMSFAKNSILQPTLGMLVALAAFALSQDVMTALYSISIDLTEKICTGGNYAVPVKPAGDDPIGALLGYSVLNSVLNLSLMLNVAKLALLQAISPLFIGFAAGQGTRRFTLNLAKEYAKCCLMPPVTAAYALVTFRMTDASWGFIASIVIGFSIWSVATKMLDRLFA